MMRAFLVLALSSVAFAFFNQQNGDKQLNNVVSRAISVLSARGALQRIQWYYTNGEINNQVPLSTSQCTRDSPLSYVGTLSNAVNRRSIRFCLSGADLGDVSKGAPYGNATEDIPLLAVTNGSLYGPSIDAGKFIALESSFILGIPISASFTICKTNIDGWFYTIYNCLAADLCDVSLPVVNHLPQWEPFVDFSCPVADSSSFNVYAIGTAPKVWKNFTGSVCSVEGTGQFVVAENFFPISQFVFQDSFPDMWDAFCNGQCDYVVDDAYSSAAALSACYSSDAIGVTLPQYSPAIDIAAITYKSSQVVVYSSASVLTVCFSCMAWIIAHLF